MQYSVELRNARGNQIEVIAGASAILKVRTAALPASCATADAGISVATITLPADWMGDAANGIKSLQGSWLDASADAAGTAQHWRLYKADGVTCVAQGTAGATGSGAEMILDNAVLAAGQQFSIATFTITEANA